MKSKVLFVALCIVGNSICHVYGELGLYRRIKREDVSGALDIVTNNAQPIHADVKLDQGKEGNEKVTPPQDGFELKALRRAPVLTTTMTTTNTLDMIRSVNRVITVLVLLGSLCVEFYPLFKRMIHYIVELLLG